MEAKKFLFKSSSILSVAILLAGLTTFGGAHAQEMQTKQKLPAPVVKVQKEDYFGLLEKADEVSKQEKVIFEVKKESPPKQKPIVTPKPKPTPPPPKPQPRKVYVVATAYTNSCTGCTGITSTGINVNNTVYYEGARVIATDPSVIPTHSVVRVDTSSGESFIAVAEDEGGAIHGNIIDVLVSSYGRAINFGRQNATITILREGA